MQILLDAALQSDQWPNRQNIPPFIFIITGKGPLKSYYEQKIFEMDLKYTSIRTAWLALEDYPKILGNFYYFM